METTNFALKKGVNREKDGQMDRYNVHTIFINCALKGSALNIYRLYFYCICILYVYIYTYIPTQINQINHQNMKVVNQVTGRDNGNLLGSDSLKTSTAVEFSR